MIQGIAAGGAKKFDGSRHAQMTRPMKKSWIVKGIIKIHLLHKRCSGTTHAEEFVGEYVAQVRPWRNV